MEVHSIHTHTHITRWLRRRWSSFTLFVYWVLYCSSFVLTIDHLMDFFSSSQECWFYTLRTEEHPNNTGVACFSTQNNQVWKFWTVGWLVGWCDCEHGNQQAIFVRRWCLHRRTTFMRVMPNVSPIFVFQQFSLFASVIFATPSSIPIEYTINHIPSLRCMRNLPLRWNSWLSALYRFTCFVSFGCVSENASSIILVRQSAVELRHCIHLFRILDNQYDFFFWSFIHFFYFCFIFWPFQK